MPMTSKQTERLAAVARELLAGLGAVESAANQELREGGGRPSGIGALAIPQNTMVGPVRAVAHLESIRQQKIQDFTRLCHEPFVTRVLVDDADGRRQALYFARATPPSSQIPRLDGRLASYRAPLGRLAETPAGESLEVVLAGRRVEFTVIERVRLVPRKAGSGWDGREDRIETGDSLVTIASLVEFLAGLAVVAVPSEDLFGAILAEAEAAAALREGIRRRVIGRMSLRDEPILDRYQGEVFRLPLNHRLVLAGPPGSGKTTTLIRRLAQKRNIEEIDETERQLVPVERAAEFFYPNNWVMFTPTELLKLYLKEAFAYEGVAASDERVRTWAGERRRLGRDVLRILRSENGGRFTLDESAASVLDLSSRGLMELADAFTKYFLEQTVAKYEVALRAIAGAGDQRLSDLAERMRIAGGSNLVGSDRLFQMVSFHEGLAADIRRLGGSVGESYRSAVNAWLSADSSGPEHLADFLDSLRVDPDEDDEEDEDDDEDEVVSAGARDRRLLAIQAVRRAIFARALALQQGRTLGKGTRNARVVDWLGTQGPDDEFLRPLGGELEVLRRLRFLAGTYRNLIDRVPAAYRRFRRTMLREGRWYRDDARVAIERGRVTGLEVDVMLLVMLRHVRRFLEGDGGRGLREDTRIASLESVKQQYVTQVLIDEAPDFSPVELACMLELAHPMFRSCFACGDVRQRVTAWGVRDWTELRWVAYDFEIRTIEIGYRQSRRLAELAAAIAKIGGAEIVRIRLPEHVDDAQVPPVLGENLRDSERAGWLCKRIFEVERAIGTLPSIAIFVDGDDRIDPLVGELSPMLWERNLDVVGCKEGRVVGTESEIRVFDVQYIKGLEFEAVFFVGVDELAKRHQDLFDKFLFVGVTRAATYLGVTCEGTLPPTLESLRAQFSTAGWD